MQSTMNPLPTLFWNASIRMKMLATNWTSPKIRARPESAITWNLLRSGWSSREPFPQGEKEDEAQGAEADEGREGDPVNPRHRGGTRLDPALEAGERAAAADRRDGKHQERG